MKNIMDQKGWFLEQKKHDNSKAKGEIEKST